MSAVFDRDAAREVLKAVSASPRSTSLERWLDVLEKCARPAAPQFVDREALADLILWAMHAGLRTDTSEVWVDRFLALLQREEPSTGERVRSPMVKCWVVPVDQSDAAGPGDGIDLWTVGDWAGWSNSIAELIPESEFGDVDQETGIRDWVRWKAMNPPLAASVVAGDVLDYIAVESGRRRIGLPGDLVRVLDDARRKFVDES